MGFWDSASQSTSAATSEVDVGALMAALLRPPPEPFIVVSPRAYFRARWRPAIAAACGPVLAAPRPAGPDVVVAPRHQP